MTDRVAELLAEKARAMNSAARISSPRSGLCISEFLIRQRGDSVESMAFVVEIESGVWLAPCDGDPGRTLDKSRAATFPTRKTAEMALRRARVFKDFRNAKIIEAW